MPCPKCQSLIVKYGKFNICPRCENVKLMNRNKAVAQLWVNDFEIESKFSAILRTNLDKSSLLIKLNWQRELFSRGFFKQYQGIDTNEFLSSNLLILRTMKEPYFKGKKDINELEITAIVDAFKRIIEAKESRLLLVNGMGEALELYDKIKVLYNENYFPILRTYEDNDILEKSKANEKIKENLPTLLSIMREKPRAEDGYSPKAFIKKHYSVINQFYCCFLRNGVFDEVFGLLDKHKQLNVPPQKIMMLVNSYPYEEGKLYHTALSEFIVRAKHYLAIDEQQIKQNLIFSERNTQNFPIFLLVNGRIYISHRSTFLIYVLLHAIVYKDLFDDETENQSKAFEKTEVKSAFERIGWKYLNNKTDKKLSSLEIDGLATCGRRMIIVECKGWKLRPFYEYQKRQSQLVRDIKGVVDGEKYTALKSKKISSLLMKIEFVKKNMGIWGLNKNDFDEIEGLIVLRNFPPITEYKGIHVTSVKEIVRKFDFREHTE